MCHRRRYDGGAAEVLVMWGHELRSAGGLSQLEKARLLYTIPRELTLVLGSESHVERLVLPRF